MENFRLSQQARCEVIAKYTNFNLLEHEWIRTGIRTLEAQIDEKNKNIEAPQNVTGSYEKNSVRSTKIPSYIYSLVLPMTNSFKLQKNHCINFLQNWVLKNAIFPWINLILTSKVLALKKCFVSLYWILFGLLQVKKKIMWFYENLWKHKAMTFKS